MIEFNNVSHSFNGRMLINNLSFRVKEGERLCFSGASGSGKSTILKILLAYVIADSGEIAIDGLILNERNIVSIRKQIIYIPQNINLLVDDALELIEMLSFVHFKSKIIENLNFLALDESVLSQNFSLLSGGEKQRLIIAICLSADNKIILLDEPSSSLDEDSIDKLIELINNQEGKTIVSVSHNEKWINSNDRIIKI